MSYVVRGNLQMEFCEWSESGRERLNRTHANHIHTYDHSSIDIALYRYLSTVRTAGGETRPLQEMILLFGGARAPHLEGPLLLACQA